MTAASLTTCLVTIMATACFPFDKPADKASVASALTVRELTGAHTRITWCRQIDGNGSDVFAEGARLQLMGFDTDDWKGERPILEKIGNYHKPLITPRGNRIVFTDLTLSKIFVINWNGASLRELSSGQAAALWMDPVTGTEWVYALPADESAKKDTGGPLTRFKVDNPAFKENVWDATPVASDSIQISTDGKYAGGLFPWPKAGVANLETGILRGQGRGCWTSLAPDNSYLLWIFDEAHRNVSMHTIDGSNTWKVNINKAPGIEGYEIYHPRWSNHIRFLCITGPYKLGQGPNRIRAGGKAVEIFIGRFDQTLSSVEKWSQITTNELADFYPDAWIDPAVVEPVPRTVKSQIVK